MTPRAHAKRVPLLAPADAFACLAADDGLFWLDSSLPRKPDGRYSIMGARPRWVFSARDDAWRLETGNRVSAAGAQHALDQLDALLDAHRVAPPDAGRDGLPFCGGAVGWLSYDLARQFETIGNSAVDDLAMPDIRLAWYDAAVVWDHFEQECWIVWAGEHGRAAAAVLESALQRPAALPSIARHPVPTSLAGNLARQQYIDRVSAVRDGIARGEYYQLNLVQRFECPHAEAPIKTYLRLRTLNPAPFSAFLGFRDGAVLSSSPERFLEATPDGWLRTCPIKGTRPRGGDEAGDAESRRDLLTSEKERAELLMIVDLLRNDLGRVCQPGSVEVVRLHDLETFATVHHLVGEVRGHLASGTTRRQLLRATFPGGSITGAPKVTAMRAIEQLEPHRRGIAMGSIGYFSAHGRIDLNIAIRTIVCQATKAYVSVGAGIVWDSEPAAEYEETLAKARALFAALNVAPP